MENENIEYDILVKFQYDDKDYVLYTDNTFSDQGEFNVYGAGIDKEGRLREVDDVDMDDVFHYMIQQYKEKVLNGELG